MSSHWFESLKRLQAIASTGMHFGASEFDLERYEEIHSITLDLLGQLTGTSIEQLQTVYAPAGKSYATPMVDVRAAVFAPNQVKPQILLVQEKSDECWTMPGGYADVGLSAVENVVKEVSEEANIDVEVVKLICVRHKVKHAYQKDLRDFYKFFFLCEQTCERQPIAGMETLQAGYFELSALPKLSTGRCIVDDVELAFEFQGDPTLSSVVD